MHTTFRSRESLGAPSDASADAHHGVVMLATLDSTPFAPDAVRLAIDVAQERAAALVTVNVITCAPVGHGLGPDLGDRPDIAAAHEESIAQAAAAGLPVTKVRLRAPRPAPALARVAEEIRPALVVFAPDPRCARGAARRRHRRALRALETRTPSLLWAPEPQWRRQDPWWERTLVAVVTHSAHWPSPRPRPWPW